ncbi:zinc knuckle CX2CX4HX4C containing protein [Tanacetum coccineum]|uniref:Zinc knuckle CX2CX4HX4C containing protein n=1 Tax=Tanacetum coccineum TaxID=301880 RepID=A0ABQ4ZZV6_9ASTR
MVGAVHAAYTNQFRELDRLVPHLVNLENKRIERYIYGLINQILRMVAATEPTTIQSVILKAGVLTDEAIRNGALKKNTKKRRNDGEPSRDGNDRDNNKRSSTGRTFSTITNPIRKEYTGEMQESDKKQGKKDSKCKFEECYGATPNMNEILPKIELWRNTISGYAVTMKIHKYGRKITYLWTLSEGSIPINRDLIQAIPTSLPPQPIGEELWLELTSTLSPWNNTKHCHEITRHRVWLNPKIECNVNFEIKSQFMRKLREDTFSGNKNEDAHDHIDRVLNIVDRLAPGTINTWYLLKKAFIQRYCPPFMTTKQLEDMHNFKQNNDESLYQAWEQYNDLLYKCPTHDINSHQKVNIFYKCLSTMNRQLLDSQGPIPGMTPARALTAIQTMADHSPKWHDGTSSKNIRNSSINDGLAALVNKLDNLGRDMKKLNESVHAIQVGCQICKGPHLDKDCPLSKEVKIIEEYFSANSGFSNDDEFKNVTSIPDEDLKQTSPKQTTTHYIEPYVPPIPFPRRLEQHAEEALIHKTMESLKKIKSNRHFLKEIRQSDEYPKHIKDLVANMLLTMENEDVKINRRCSALLLNQLPPKEKDTGSFILPCSIGRLDVNNTLADLGANINIMPFSMYKRLGIGKLETIKMNIELADNSKCIPKGIVRNLLIKIDKFILPIDFIILDALENFRMHVILGKPLLATAHAKVDVFRKVISLEVGNEKVIFKMKSDLPDIKNESVLMIKSNMITEEDELMNIESGLFTYITNTCESCHILAVDPDLFTYENLHEEWFKGTSEDEDNNEEIIDYLEQTSYDGFVDLDEEEFNKRRCRLLGMPYIEPLPIIIKQVKITRYSLGPGEVYTKVKVSNMEELPRTRNNIAAIRSNIMDEVFENYKDEMT